MLLKMVEVTGFEARTFGAASARGAIVRQVRILTKNDVDMKKTAVRQTECC